MSVIIPTHNRAHIIASTIESALAQTYRRTEILVVDDGSNDHTAEIVRRFPQVRFFQKAQGGPASARNLALSHSTGSVVAMLDSDDSWDPDYLESAVRALVSTGAGLVCTSFRGRKGDGTLSYSNYYREIRPHLASYLTRTVDSWFVLEPGQARDLFIAHAEAPSSATVLRKETLLPGWDNRLFGTEDHLILIQAAMDHRCKVAFDLEARWTKNTDTGNIYDGSSALARHARMNILTSRIVRERWGSELTPAELAILRHRDAVEYADWAYYESKQGRRLGSLWKYLQSFFADSSVVRRRFARSGRAA